MWRTLAASLAAAVGALTLASAGSAATRHGSDQEHRLLAGDDHDQPRRQGHLAQRRQGRPPGGRGRRLLRVPDPPRRAVLDEDALDRGHVPLPRRALPEADRQDHGQGPAAVRLARPLGADRRLRNVDHALRRDLHRRGEPVGRARPAAVRPGVAEPDRDRQDRRRRRVLLDDHAEPLHDVHRALEQRHERERRRPGRAEDEARSRAAPAT